MLQSRSPGAGDARSGPQAQAQAQSQAVFGDILRRLEGLHQVAASTNSNIIAGNQGAVQTGAQSSTPTNIGRV